MGNQTVTIGTMVFIACEKSFWVTLREVASLESSIKKSSRSHLEIFVNQTLHGGFIDRNHQMIE
jgi:hypothetical protein